MKRIFTLLCLIITMASTSQTTFKTRINTGISNQIFEVIQINDGSYIGIGDNYGDTSDDILLVKLSQQGALLSSQTVHTPGFNEGISVIKTADGGFAVSGSLDEELAILKFDVNLGLQWKKSYPSSGSGSDGTRIIEIAGGGFIVVGDVYNDDDDGSAGYLIKTDSQGNVLLARRYFDFSADYHNIVDIVSTSDGNYALLAEVVSYNDSTEAEIDSTYLIKINTTGSILWSRYIKTSRDFNFSVSLLQASDGGLLIAGSTSRLFNLPGFPFELPQMLMTKFDAAGTLLWSKSIETLNISASFAFSVFEDNDGGYVFSGQLSTINDDLSTGNSYPYLVKLNSGGALQWTKTFDKADLLSYYIFSSGLTSIIRTSDGGYAVSGISLQQSSNEPIPNGIIYKFNNNFGICGDVGSSGSVVNEGTGAEKSVVVHDITPVATNVNVTMSSGFATAVDNCVGPVVTIYTFTGNGNWSEAANWSNNIVPPSPLPQHSRVVIDPTQGGECILDVEITIPQGDSLTVKSGKKFRIPDNLNIN